MLSTASRMNRSPFHDGVTMVSFGNRPALMRNCTNDVACVVAEAPRRMIHRPSLAHGAVQEIRIGSREALLEMNAGTPTQRGELGNVEEFLRHPIRTRRVEFDATIISHDIGDNV